MPGKRQYNTTQKQLVAEFLQNNADRHFTISELDNLLRAGQSPVGATTIYRHLEALAKDGLVRKYTLPDRTCYQFDGPASCSPEHFHLKCSACGALIHLDCSFLCSIQSHLQEQHQFILDPFQTIFYGLCSQCQET